MKKIVIIGGGVMGGIFTQALATNYQVTVCGKTEDKIVCREADFILLAIKPQSFPIVVEELLGNLGRATIISIMAGVTIAKIQTALGVKSIVRAMPNLGAKVKKSMTVWTGKNLTNENEIDKIFSQVGETLFVTEETFIDQATAVSGCGPGFFFYLISEWLKAIVELGFSQAQAEKLLLTTLNGSMELLRVDMRPGVLASQVASKGGSTEAGLKVLNEANLSELWSKTLQAALKRTKELNS